MCYLLLGEDSEVGHLWWCHESDKNCWKIVIQRLWFSEMICTGSFLTWIFWHQVLQSIPTPAVTSSALCGVVSGAKKSKAYLWSHDHSQGFKIVPRFGFADFGGWGVLAGNWRLEILRVDIKKQHLVDFSSFSVFFWMMIGSTKIESQPVLSSSSLLFLNHLWRIPV